MKKAPYKPFLNFKNEVKSILTAGYNVAPTVIKIKISLFPFVHCVNLTSATSLLSVFV